MVLTIFGFGIPVGEGVVSLRHALRAAMTAQPSQPEFRSQKSSVPLKINAKYPHLHLNPSPENPRKHSKPFIFAGAYTWRLTLMVLIAQNPQVNRLTLVPRVWCPFYPETAVSKLVQGRIANQTLWNLFDDG